MREGERERESNELNELNEEEKGVESRYTCIFMNCLIIATEHRQLKQKEGFCVGKTLIKI